MITYDNYNTYLLIISSYVKIIPERNLSMEVIGLIAEYNPFHNGHLYQIEMIKKRYPDSLIILILNGYFLERGHISLESKEEKTRLALKYGIDLVIELPFIFGSNSADIFASASLELLNALKVNKIVFGSESDDVKILKDAALKQLDKNFEDDVKKYLDMGYNYPTALNKANDTSIREPNDLLGLSYIKAIIQNNYPIEPITIKRTNSYHDTASNEDIISASNIRHKLKEGIDITPYIPEGNIETIDEELLLNIIKYRINTDDISKYLSVDEGIDNRLKRVIDDAKDLDELVNLVKSKRYTYNRIMRMLIHILLGVTKEDKGILKHNEYLRILGFNDKGSKYIRSLKSNLSIPLFQNKQYYLSREYELRAAKIYSMLTHHDVLKFERQNKPLKKED